MTSSNSTGPDPFHLPGGDPWPGRQGRDAAEAYDPDYYEPDDEEQVEDNTLPPQFGQPTRTYAQHDEPAHKVVNDAPPVWDGRNPEKQTEPYLKLLEGWLSTTRTLKRQQGMTIMQFARDDLRLIINELDITTLTSEDSGRIVFEHIKENYKDYTDQPMPKAFDAAIFSHEGHRRKGESLMIYASRKNALFKDLDRAKCVLPNDAKGYFLLKDATISGTAWDTITTWTRGSYDYKTI